VDWVQEAGGARWIVEVPGRFGDPEERAAKSVLPGLLAASRPGVVASQGSEISSGVLEIVLSREPLRSLIPFGEVTIPTASDVVHVGALVGGSSALWDLGTHPHGLLIGQTLSGKSELAAAVLAQLSAKGWQLAIVTPKVGDPILTPFAAAGHRVLTGQDDGALSELVDLFRWIEEDRAQRQKVQEAHGARRWRDLPPEVLAERPPFLLLIDESRSYLTGHKGEGKQRATDKSEIHAGWLALLQAGRSAGQHGLIVTQSADVESLGGGFAAGQLSMVVALRSLRPTFWPAVFPASAADLSLLASPRTGPGRGIGRGLVSDGPLSIGDDIVLQAPLMSDSEREAVLAGAHAPVRAPSVQGSPVVVSADVESEAPVRVGVLVGSGLVALWLVVLLVALVVAL